jgi:hypothetical protein
MRRRHLKPAMRTWPVLDAAGLGRGRQLTTSGHCLWKVIYREVWRRGYVQASSDREAPDAGRDVVGRRATELVMKLQNEGKGDRELLCAVALLATAVI